MKKSLYDYALKHGINRRSFVKGSISWSYCSNEWWIIINCNKFICRWSLGTKKSYSTNPGVGAGSPGDADWQKVGEMCLGGTKERGKKESLKELS